MTTTVFLNGEFIAKDQAGISVLDRGFLFGDGVYEVIPVYAGKPFRLIPHLDRLQRSLDAVEMKNSPDQARWVEVLTELVNTNCPGQDASIYLQVTRGVMESRDHAYSCDLTPTVLAMCDPRTYQPMDSNTPGAKAVTLEDNRWLDSHIKSTNLLANVMLRQKAVDQGAAEAILIRDGNAIEGAASNLFIVKDDIVRTPPLSRYMLGGITRDVIIGLCNEQRIIVQEKPVIEDELHDADEIWLTSSVRQILPITELNQHKVGNGEVGPKWKQVAEMFEAYKVKLAEGV